MRTPCTIIFFLALVAGQAARAEIKRIWLTHQSPDPGRLVVNWETAQPGASIVRFGADRQTMQTIGSVPMVTLHHVEMPLGPPDTVTYYRVQTGDECSAVAAVRSLPRDGLRVAVVADWQSRPPLDALLRDAPHLLLTAGDNVDGLHQPGVPGPSDNTHPYSALIDRYPELFRSTPFLPALGNHDREIRPRGPKPPAEPVYDIDATAFRTFFELPDDEWKWHFDIPEFAARFIALDMNHLSDQGTTWQTCHPVAKDSEQFAWYDKLTATPQPPFVVTIDNEQNSNVRRQAGGGWGTLLARSTIVITGFGAFAERAEVGGLTYYNTSLSGKGDRYPDPQSRLLVSEHNYLLLTFTKQPSKMTVEIKALDGRVLDRKDY